MSETNEVRRLAVGLEEKGIDPDLPDLCLEFAALVGNMEWVRDMIERGATNWNRGLEEACLCGHMETVHEMIRRGADDLDRGFMKACEGGHIDIVQEMIGRGTTAWNCGLMCACQFDDPKHLDIMVELIRRGGAFDQNWTNLLQLNMIKLLNRGGPPEWFPPKLVAPYIKHRTRLEQHVNLAFCNIMPLDLVMLIWMYVPWVPQST
jgi:hypothetical protein